jgi:hypothetical protein
MKTKERIEKLERELAELKKELKPEFKAGWYKNTVIDLEDILIYWDEEKKSLYGFDTSGNWFDDEQYGFHEDYDIPATDKEVQEALIEEAKRRGFKEGVTCRFNGETFKLELKDFYIEGITLDGTAGFRDAYGNVVFKDGKWAEIIKTKVIINGYEMNQDGDIISFGCGKFNKEFFIHLYYSIRYCNGGADQNSIGHIGIRDETNRKIKSITLDSDVTITVEQLKQIVDNIK